jgi:hypothetical protein
VFKTVNFFGGESCLLVLREECSCRLLLKILGRGEWDEVWSKLNNSELRDLFTCCLILLCK